MNMYLAAILGLCALTNSPVAMIAFSTRVLALVQESQPQADPQPAGSTQEPAQNPGAASPAQGTSRPSQETGTEKTGAEKAAPEKTGTEKSGPEQSLPTSITPLPKPGQPLPKAQPEPSAKKPKSAAKTAAKKRRRKHVAGASGSAPEKKVIRNGGTADPVVHLAPGVSDEQASRQRQSTTELLATTDSNLKQLAARQLSVTQQDSVSQIRKYMEQAKTAEDTGDVQRAQNLASKALLLSDDLVKH
jgi:hypothetical protein